MFCVIALGSNLCGTENLSMARKHLKELFPDIRFSVEEETFPIGSNYIGKFTNQVACFTCGKQPGQIRRLFKEIEREAGRRLADKEKGIVRLDIDLLMCDKDVYKPEDMRRDYIRRGLHELRISVDGMTLK